MLCVTMTMVKSSFSSWIRSSIASVEMGSRAEQGSSMSRTSGSTAMARAMHRRCCWPPESPPPGLSRRSLTSSQRFAERRDFSATSLSFFLFFSPDSFRPATTLSSMDMVGNGLGRWNTMPMVLRTDTGSIFGP